jgi:penicillin-binding protein 1B
VPGEPKEARNAPRRKSLKVKVPAGAALPHFVLRPAGQIFVALSLITAVGSVGAFTYYYTKYSRLIDEKLRYGPFANTSKIFAAPRVVVVREAISPEEVVSELRAAGYSESRRNPVGSYHLRPNAVEIFPGPAAYAGQEAGVLTFSGNKIVRIVSLQDNTERTQYQLEPQLITNLSDRNRQKRRIVPYSEIPQVLIRAITSAEDKRFFQHAGFDPIRIAKAVYVDLREGRKAEGASTLSQQLARSIWLTLDKRWDRKLAELMITLQLEQRLSKEKIFEYYCNEVYLGHRGTFAIRGFGEAAQVYFGKDIRELTVPDAAALAGLVQKPMRIQPFRYPERLVERRNIVLSMMRQNGYISDREYALAIESPLNLARGSSQSADAPYFVDLVNDDLGERFQDVDFQAHSYRVYTTLDLDLQRAAGEAVRIGIAQVDELVKKRRKREPDLPEPQAALVALDPHTGEIKALVGGRNYGVSQLNRAVAKRQPGSIFKPFVYAAAMDSALEGGSRVFTPASSVVDEPTTFWFDGKPYDPSNFKHEFYGQVTLRRALAKSMNVATVKVAEAVGYDRVADLARRAGMNYGIHATPSIALGAYEVTPIEIAGAYTIFANRGVLVKPSMVASVRAQDGKVIYTNKQKTTQVLDPRVAYLIVNMMEEVMRSGTAAGVRSRGLTLPAAGKTGTSRDGWFAGFTSELLCIVWVGFDDNRELNLEGAHSALPIWTEFMKRASSYRAYRNAKPFAPPDGVVAMEVDSQSGMPATPSCPQTRTEVFIAGTQPIKTCPLHGGHGGTMLVAGWDEPPAPRVETIKPLDPATISAEASRIPAAAAGPMPSSREPGDEPRQEKKGIFRRLLNVFK